MDRKVVAEMRVKRKEKPPYIPLFGVWLGCDGQKRESLTSRSKHCTLSKS